MRLRGERDVLGRANISLTRFSGKAKC